jgi:hypothetical protein
MPKPAAYLSVVLLLANILTPCQSDLRPSVVTSRTHFHCLYAIDVARHYPVLGSDFLIRTVRHGDTEPVIIENAPEETSEAGNKWALSLHFRPGKKVEIQSRGIQRLSASTPHRSQNAKMSKAIIKSLQFLMNKDHFCMPCIIKPSQTPQEFRVALEDVPGRPGGHRTVILSRDLKQLEFYAGR